LPTATYGDALVSSYDIFESAGIDPVEGLAAWDALFETRTVLIAASIKPISAGWRDGYLPARVFTDLIISAHNAERLAAF